MTELNLDKLNKQQKEAVTHGEGPLLIVAGAGTGKTTVITQRVAWLVERGLAAPEEMLAVTFTDKAAGEMEERVDGLLEMGYADMWISTFHSFCQRVLGDNALDIGLPPNFKLLDATLAWLLVRQNLAQFHLDYYKPLGNPTKFIHALIAHFSRCKDQGIYPEDYLKYADDLKTNLTDLKEGAETERIKEVASAYHAYQKLLLENNVLDFGDLINYCALLFRKRPKILEKYREKFKYILVDEFQDTNWAQYDLVKMLSAPKNNLTVTADDDQSIYKWRGASFSNIIQFKKDFPKAKEVFLIQNYRSRQNILDLSYQFVQANNPARLEYVSKIDKKLKAWQSGQGAIEHLHYKTLEQEAEGVVKKIAEIMKKDKEACFSHFAILVRANDHAKPFVRVLERAGIPYQFLASRGLYTKPIILDVISYFKLLDDYHESAAVYRVLNLPFLEIPTEDIMRLNLYAQRKAKSVYEALQELPLVRGVSSDAAEKLNFILGLIKKHTQLVKTRPVSEVLVAFLKDSGYLKYLADQEESPGQSSWAELDVLNQFARKIEQFEAEAIEPCLRAFMEQLNWELEADETGKLEFDLSEGPDLVNLMTVHAAKGLEFPYVFLVNMVDRRFPTTERKEPIEIPDELIKDIKPEGDVHLQEERRLCYVAMTRAKKGLFFTSADDYGGQQKKKPSRFLIELGFEKKEPDKHVLPKTQTGLAEKMPRLEPMKVGSEEVMGLPPHFSYSQLAAFEKCPLQYKFAHILRVPVRGRAVFTFGKTMHNTLYEFLKRANEKRVVAQDNLFGFNTSVIPSDSEGSLTFKDLEKIYNERWIDAWYETKQQKEEYQKLGRKIIKEFYEKFKASPPKVLKIDQEPALEVNFHLRLGDYLVKGKIDRIDQAEGPVPSGAEGGVKLIDYKTGTLKEKLDTESKQQLLIYQIAAEEVYNLNPVELTYHYLEDNKELSFLGSEKEKQQIKQKIIDTVEKIKQSGFTPSPGWHCRTCDFRDICNYAQK